MFYTFFAIAKNARRKAIDHGSPKKEPDYPSKTYAKKNEAIGQIWGEPCLGSSWTGPRLPFFTTNESLLLIEIKRGGFSNTSTFGYQTTSSKQNMREPSECQGVLEFVGLSWYDVYLLILGVWVSCFYVWCVSHVRFLCGRWDDGRLLHQEADPAALAQLASQQGGRSLSGQKVAWHRRCSQMFDCTIWKYVNVL